MKQLLTAIATKISGSALSTAVGGRIYLDRAPAGTPVFPYVVYFIVSANQTDTFSSKIDEILIQFSLFSASESASQISDLYGNLIALFDDASMTITGNTLVSFVRENLTTMVEDTEATDAVSGIKHWSIDYKAIIERT